MASQGTTPDDKTHGGPNKNWACDPRAIMTVLASASFVGALFIQYIVKHAGSGTVHGLALFIALFLFLSFLYLFTGSIGKIKMTGMVIFCYSFTAFAIMVSVVPFALFDTKWPVWEKKFREAPLGVIKGCSVELQSGTVPDEIKCVPAPVDEPQKAGAVANYQWVVNIGGSVRSSRMTGGAGVPAEQPATAPVPPVAPGEPPENGHGAALTKKGDDTVPSVEELAPVPPPGNPPEPNTQADYARIHGGIVVPLYVVVLALIGGAVSMTRRVPEYQRQVWMHYWCDDEGGKTPAGPPVPEQGAAAGAAPDSAAAQQPDKEVTVITGPAAREYLVFQLMQVISAPLIAIVAYYAFAPKNPAASVAVGFASGFTSETILLGIRGLAEKLTPSSKAEKPSE